MNEKHYDNLCEISKRLGIEGSEMMAAVAMHNFLRIDSRNRDETVSCIAALYNALDVLCIAIDCEDDVQDMAEYIAAENQL